MVIKFFSVTFKERFLGKLVVKAALTSTYATRTEQAVVRELDNLLGI